MRIASYKRYGPPGVIEISDVFFSPSPGDDELVIRVAAVGLNPADSKVRRGQVPLQSLPSGLGRELSGVVVGLGAQVKDFFLGQSVLGTGNQLLREMVTLPASMVAPIPEGLDWERAACLPVAGQTAWTAIESQNVHPGETAIVSAAAGGVGQFMCQILRHRGVNVIGTASVRNHPHLRSMGIVPIKYGPGLAGRLKRIIPGSGIHHVFDQSGAEMLEAALELGVPRSKINSVSGLGPTYGVPSLGRVGLDRDVVNLLGQAINDGDLNLQVKSFPMERVVEAFVELENPSDIGKVVMRLMPNQHGNSTHAPFVD